MTSEEWSIVGTLLGIVLFVSSSFGFGFKGFKDWKKSEATEASRVKWGKIQVGLSVILSIFAIACVIVLICIVKSGIINSGDRGSDDSSESLPIISTMIIETLDSKPDGIYVTDQSYQGAIYSGYVNELRHPDGEGTMKYSDGKVYTGDWVDGVQQGQGRMQYNNNDIYDGEWSNGKRNGKGTYTWSDEKKYEGTYVDDVRNGEGIFSGWVDLTNGYSGTYYGESKNDQFDGSGYFLFDNGDRFDGIYKENLYWTGVYTRKDGSSFEVINGKPQ